MPGRRAGLVKGTLGRTSRPPLNCEEEFLRLNRLDHTRHRTEETRIERVFPCRSISFSNEPFLFLCSGG